MLDYLQLKTYSMGSLLKTTAAVPAYGWRLTHPYLTCGHHVPGNLTSIYYTLTFVCGEAKRLEETQMLIFDNPVVYKVVLIILEEVQATDLHDRVDRPAIYFRVNHSRHQALVFVTVYLVIWPFLVSCIDIKNSDRRLRMAGKYVRISQRPQREP